ncbi:MAG: long-chain-acyl-CoA synthetase [Alphaproteobacteria bacterium]|nr:long-chain-acyl-CoA synthetase [Alphaproteobacteria bacterium]
MSEKHGGTDKRARDAWLRALQRTASIGTPPHRTLPVAIDEVAHTYPGRPALIGERDGLTYRELADCSRQYAGWAVRHMATNGRTVCLIMRNCPEFLAIWLGITRVGGLVALINHRLEGRALMHAISVAAPVHIIVDAALVAVLEAVLPLLIPAPAVWVCGADSPGHRRIDREIDAERETVIADLPRPQLTDRALYIYTSGTTGMPKAAIVSHFRILQWSQWFAGMMDAGPSDRMYNCLPMYHSVGGVVASCAMLVSGGSVVIRERFSASRFWDDVASSRATIFQYIGELCRYLVRNPPHPKETAHCLRLSCGNGLPADVWPEFRGRFGIAHNLEFYAATEANFSLFNCEDEAGSIGRIPPFLAHRFPVALVKFDVARGEPLRGPDGLCVRCGTDEVGEAISKLPDATSPAGVPFEGYTDSDASAKKILYNVFVAGDAWYRSGDLMRRDARGFFYFVDRIGDTFRWKGENVSTTEAAAAIGSCPGVVEVVVYGVSVPGGEGRAGMAAIVVTDAFDFASLQRHLAAVLPAYAQPLFVRVCSAIEATETFKQKKQDLVREGYDPSKTTDPLYFADREAGAYVPLDRALYDRIARCEIGF